MRTTVVRLAFALSLLVPLGAWSAAPAGAVTSGCKTIKGTVTFSPGLPILGSTATVTPTVKTTGLISGCTGGGVTSGRTTQTTKSTKAVNCGTPRGTTTGRQKITWNTGAISTATTKLVPVTGQTLQSRLTSTIIAGKFKGTKTTVVLKATALLPSGACTKVPLTKMTFASTAPPKSIPPA